MLVVFRFLLSLKKAFLRNTSEWLLLSNLQHSLVEHLVVSSLLQFLMTSLEFTDHFPGSNKVHYPISDGKDFTLVFTSVVGRQNYINIWCIIILIYVFLSKCILIMRTNLQESSADWFKLTNEILIIKGNIILCGVPCKNFMWLMTVLFPQHFPLWYGTSSRYKWHTFATVQYKKRKMSWIEG